MPTRLCAEEDDQAARPANASRACWQRQPIRISSTRVRQSTPTKVPGPHEPCCWRVTHALLPQRQARLPERAHATSPCQKAPRGRRETRLAHAVSSCPVRSSRGWGPRTTVSPDISRPRILGARTAARWRNPCSQNLRAVDVRRSCGSGCAGSAMYGCDARPPPHRWPNPDDEDDDGDGSEDPPYAHQSRPSSTSRLPCWTHRLRTGLDGMPGTSSARLHFAFSRPISAALSVLSH